MKLELPQCYVNVNNDSILNKKSCPRTAFLCLSQMFTDSLLSILPQK